MKYKGVTHDFAKSENKKGLNEIENKKKRPFLKKCFSSLLDPGVILLSIASFISFLLKEYIDSAIILFVIFLNSIISLTQENKASKALEKIKALASPRCNVVREGKIINIESKYVCKDDIVYLSEGDVIPADGILLEVNNLLIDESLFSGESFPLLKKEKDKVYASTLVCEGNAYFQTTKIGMDSEVGKIASCLHQEETKTLLQKKISKLSLILGIFSCLIVVFIFLLSVIQKRNLKEMLLFSLSLAVAALPEGLIVLVTITLAFKVNELSKKNVLVRNLHSIETLGSINVVCVDKTGTITKNELSLVNIDSNNLNAFNKILNYSLPSKTPYNDPLDKCIYSYLKKENAYVESKKIIEEDIFSSSKKYSGNLILNDSKIGYFIKGAPEIILSKCSYYLSSKEKRIDEKIKNQIINEYKKRMKEGKRVIAFAYSNGKKEDMVYGGIASFFDEPKEGVKESIYKIHKAGIDVKMITGDSLLTAVECAKQIGILKNENEAIEKEIPSSIKGINVFSRISPQNKMEIVQLLQKENKIVLMTGDGVNDAPSLKKCDIGISMGRGSEVSKESSDICILDDNFNTIEVAVEEGRTIYQNIKKSVLFLLSSNLGEILVIFFFVLFNLPTPLLSIHILWVNLISDSLPSLALGLDAKYEGIMDEAPRKKNESFFSKGGYKITLVYGIIIFLITSFAFLLNPIMTLISSNININLDNLKLVLQDENLLMKSRTLAFSTLSISQLFHMVGMSNIKKNILTILKRKNKLMIVSFLSGLILQLICVSIPFFASIFKTTKLGIDEILFVIILSMVPLAIHEVLIKTYKTNL